MSARANLATRPFYNERLVRLVLALAALVVLAATVFNISRLVALTSRERALGAQASAAEARTAEMRREASRLRTGIDAAHVAQIAAATHEVNLAIDQRAFSWTALFNQLEAALPADARLTAVKPDVDDQGRLSVTATVVGRSVGAVDRFLDGLEKSGAFHDLLSLQDRETKEGGVEATIKGRYEPPVNAALRGAR